MAAYVAYDPEAEVNGEAILSSVRGTGPLREMALKILKENGIDPKPGKWYKQQAWLDSFRAIGEMAGDSVLRMIGRTIPESALFPPGIRSPEEAFAAIDVAYQANHRNGEIGSYIYKKNGVRSANIICDNPYPCAFNEGLIRAVAEKYCKQGPVRVSHGEDGNCGDTGAGVCTFHVEW